MSPTPEPQKKYNHSDKGRKVRSEWNKQNRQHLEKVRGDRTGECSICGKSKWLVRKYPPTCRKCNQKTESGVATGDERAIVVDSTQCNQLGKISTPNTRI